MEVIIKYGLAVIREKRLLVCRKQQTSFFILPGGKPMGSEAAIECLSRELKEELLVGIKKGTLSFLGIFQDKAANEPDKSVKTYVYLGEIDGEPIPSSEIVEISWFGKSSDPAFLSPVLRNKIVPDLVKKGLI